MFWLLHSKDDEQSLRELSSKFRSEEKPSESWISGKINLYYDSDAINVEQRCVNIKLDHFLCGRRLLVSA